MGEDGKGGERGWVGEDEGGLAGWAEPLVLFYKSLSCEYLRVLLLDYLHYHNANAFALCR